MARIAAGLLLAGLVCQVSCNAVRSRRTLSGPVSDRAQHGLQNWPHIVLWAWERPEDLHFIDPRREAVSYLVKTLLLAGDGVAERPNLNELRAPAGTRLMACARVEASRQSDPSFSTRQAELAASSLARLAEFPSASAIQIDFDAIASERSFYRKLLILLRQRIPASLPLSITALASWCQGDRWMAGLPVDEAVPMLFRMGPDRDSILIGLQHGDGFTEPLCRGSEGISFDEFTPIPQANQRLYLFCPDGWTDQKFNVMISQLRP